MYLIRDVFTAKPGKAKDLVRIFLKAKPFMEKEGEFRNTRVMTDLVANFWTVVVESEVDNLDSFQQHSRDYNSRQEVREIMGNYMDHVIGGHREIFKLEELS